MRQKDKDKSIKLTMLIVLINSIITDLILILWFKYSLAYEWLFFETKTNLIEFLKTLSNAYR